MIRIALLAGPGAGKTTLANALTARLKDLGYRWYNVQEYAREFIDKHGPDAASKRMSIPLLIANKQISRERRVPKTCDGFVTDSPLILPWFYATNLAAEPVEKYEILTSLYQMFLRSFLDYTLIVSVRREKKYDKDGTRFQTEDEARGIDSWIRGMVLAHGFELFEVSGKTETRVNQIVRELEKRGLIARKARWTHKAGNKKKDEGNSDSVLERR